jgi:hypothetical protein
MGGHPLFKNALLENHICLVVKRLFGPNPMKPNGLKTFLMPNLMKKPMDSKHFSY